MRSAFVAIAIALLFGCAFADGKVRTQAATDFACSREDVWVESANSGYLAYGCSKEAAYVVESGRATRTSEIRPSNLRPPLWIDRIPGTNSLGLD